MRRRCVIAAGVAFLTSAPISWAQPSPRIFRLAIVHPDRSVSLMMKENNPLFEVFFRELAKSGFFEGINLTVERFDGGGVSENYKKTADSAVSSQPDVILSISDRMTKLVKDITSQIPIVATTSDPIAYGLAKYLRIRAKISLELW